MEGRPLIIVCATPMNKVQFEVHCPMAESAKRLSFDNQISLKVFFENRKGLPEIYNQAIDKAPLDANIAFVHSDVWILDYWIRQQIQRALQQYDVIGLAGSRELPPEDEKSSWSFRIDEKEFKWRNGRSLCGAVAHGSDSLWSVTSYGECPAQVELLDGVFLATSVAMLKLNGIRFDEQFTFDLYDVDFSRTCTKEGFRLGVWPINIVHASGGRFGADAWWKQREAYLKKWKSESASSLPVITSHSYSTTPY